MAEETNSSGRLNRLVHAPATDLSALPSRDLAAELLVRLRRGDAVASSNGDLAGLLALLSMELEVRTDTLANRFSRMRARELFHMGATFQAMGVLQVKGATIVELGCGSQNPLAGLLIYLLAGARRAIGVDLDPVHDEVSAVRALARLATYALALPECISEKVRLTREQVFAGFSGFDLMKLWQGDPAGIDSERLVLKRESAEHLSLPDGEADLTYSVSFLEHVANPTAVVQELARVTRLGGVGVHTIDGQDHGIYSDRGVHALDFLRVPGGDALVRGCNRLRPTEFPAVFEAGGFEVLSFEPHQRIPVTEELRQSFEQPFRSMPREALEVVSAGIRVRRRG
jgi:SAM-dependent methyltransferase